MVILFVALRLNLSDAMLNIDELIPLKVSEGMSSRGDLDPNWRLADLPWFWNIDQYNFYLYNIVAHGVLQAGAWLSAPPLPALRLANLVFQVFAFAFCIDAVRRIGLGRFGLALVGALLTVAPGMVQDAGMARPESLLYLIVALQIWILTLGLSAQWCGFLFGVILGLGVGIKVSYALAVVMIAVPWAISWRQRPSVEVLGGAALLCVGTALGFVAGAPYEVVHPRAFLSGLATLAEQYNFGQPPHSLQSYDPVSEALWIGRYFIELYGLVPLAALAAPFLLKGSTRNLGAGFVLVWVLLFVYFAGKAVFYERNFSFTLIPMLLAVGLATTALRQNYWRVTAAVVLLLPMGYWSIQIASAANDRASLRRFEAMNGLSPSLRLDFADVRANEVPASCQTVAIEDFNESWTAAYLVMLEGNGFHPIARYRSRFSTLVTSTLHTYLDTDVHYFRCPELRH